MWPTKVTYISFATVPIATKLAKVVAYLVVYLLIWIIWEIENISPLPECLWPIQLGGWWHAMPRSGCSALHGVNPNLKKKKPYGAVTHKVICSFSYVSWKVTEHGICNISYSTRPLDLKHGKVVTFVRSFHPQCHITI